MNDNYTKLILNELLPALEKDYNISKNPDDRAIAGTSSGAIYQYKISGNTGTRVAVVRLDDTSAALGPFWITSNRNAQTLYAPIAEDSIERVGVYRYPAGGKPLQNLYDAPLPFAAAVSMPK